MPGTVSSHFQAQKGHHDPGTQSVGDHEDHSCHLSDSETRALPTLRGLTTQ